jgi:hypothetical protein
MRRVLFSTLCFSLGYVACLQAAEESGNWQWVEKATDYFCDVCCINDPPDRFWVSGDYLFWWIKDSPAPVPLAVEGPPVAAGSPLLGQPGTTIVLGNKSIVNDPRSGGKFAVGLWFDDDHAFSTEIGYLFLISDTKTHNVRSDGLPGSTYLGLPFFNVTTLSESSTQIASPGNFSGKATEKVSNFMQGAEWNFLARVTSEDPLSLKIVAGFRYWNFNERFKFSTNSPFIPPRMDVFITKDRFQTHNHFYGGQLGLDFAYAWKRLFIAAKGKIAVGSMQGKLSIDGQLFTNDFNNFRAVEDIPAGYFALSTNHGHHTRDRIAIIPEFNLDLGCRMASWATLRVGYTFLYATKVMWGTNQLDRRINPSQAPAITSTPSTAVVGPASPKPLFRTDPFWAQGLNIGLDFSF